MKAVIVCGATGTGKTDLAFQLAEKLNCEILNFDSIQIYRELNIGAAKPPAKYLSKIKHHLLDEVSPEVNFTAGDFRRAALKILKEQSVKHKFIVLVGGTGFYLNALLNGMFAVTAPPQEIKDQLLEELKSKGIEKLFTELRENDPTTAAKLHINDHYRILRALEILRAQKVKPSEIQKTNPEDKFPYEYLKIGLKREKPVIQEAIHERSKKMLELGLMVEVDALVKKYGPHIKALQSVGYKEAFEALGGDLPDLIEKITVSTMQLVKKQNTWFKRDEEINWFDPDKVDVLAKTLELLDFKP